MLQVPIKSCTYITCPPIITRFMCAQKSSAVRTRAGKVACGLLVCFNIIVDVCGLVLYTHLQRKKAGSKMNHTPNGTLKIKDLTLIGIFLVIYYIIIGIASMTAVFCAMAANSVTVSLACFALAPLSCGVITGPLVILLMTKIQKPWGFFIFGIIPSFLLAFTGHTFIVPLVGVVFVAAAEAILRAGHYTSFRAMLAACSVFNIWTTLPLVAVFFSEKMQTSMIKKMGTDLFVHVFTVPHIALIMVVALIAGALGALLGHAMLKKHFEKAGIA